MRSNLTILFVRFFDSCLLFNVYQLLHDFSHTVSKLFNCLHACIIIIMSIISPPEVNHKVYAG